MACTWARSSSSRPRPERQAISDKKRRSKTALVLGGGGFTGGVYEIGALRAFDLLAVNRTVNEFDVYVGTSAGSFVATMLANGVTPEEMMRVLNKRLPSPIKDVDLGTLLRPNYRAYLQKAAVMPLRLVGTARKLLSNLGDVSLMDFGVGLAEGLPTGHLLRPRDRPLRRGGALRPRPRSTTSGCSTASST